MPQRNKYAAISLMNVAAVERLKRTPNPRAAMTYAFAIKHLPLSLLRFSVRTTKGTIVWSLTIVWLLFFVLVLIPLAWLALAIIARWSSTDPRRLAVRES